jgi:2-polyprenyl-3-methyl-5-hydroxy-6-metoxy-1,4-benzoquinol methylase
MDQSVINGYVTDSDYLIQAFEAIDSAVLLSHISAFLPEVPADIVDIGAGTGRDAEWLASLGHKRTSEKIKKNQRKTANKSQKRPHEINKR